MSAYLDRCLVCDAPCPDHARLHRASDALYGRTRRRIMRACPRCWGVASAIAAALGARGSATMRARVLDLAARRGEFAFAATAEVSP
ncbi:MAG TPA: hypothetical protein VNE82_12750 [Candidatus Binataceae bacterium]|nr:hypothetical protein [Candidatus Binataceae bacterium]HVB80800.1 hypothetical protein [Candidatus Binataceae bacterium]